MMEPSRAAVIGGFRGCTARRTLAIVRTDSRSREAQVISRDGAACDGESLEVGVLSGGPDEAPQSCRWTARPPAQVR